MTTSTTTTNHPPQAPPRPTTGEKAPWEDGPDGGRPTTATTATETQSTQTTTTGTSVSPVPALLPNHYRELHEGSGLSNETITRSGIESELNHARLGSLLNRKWPRSYGPALKFPFFDESGTVVLWRVKPDNPPRRNGKVSGKYLSPKGSAVRAYIPPWIHKDLADTGRMVLIAEGEKKALAGTQSGILTIGLTGVDCWHQKKSSALVLDLDRIHWNGRHVFIVFDSDAATNENVATNEKLLAQALKTHGAIVRIVRLPPGTNGEKVGLDDYLVANGADALWKLVEQAVEPEEPNPEDIKVPASQLDPATEAKRFLDRLYHDGVCRLRYWRGSFYFWSHGAYCEHDKEQVRGELIRYVNTYADHLTTNIVNNLIDQLKAQSAHAWNTDPPAWLGEPPVAWPVKELLVARNGIFHLPSIAAGMSSYCLPPTPRLFSTVALDYDLALNAPKPERWLRFMGELWPDDPQIVETLQEFIGYLLVADTSQQKILFLISPKRGGKGTIARIIRALIGIANVAGPTLATLALPFGLWPLLDKSVAIIPDARLSSRSDKAIVTERLLAVSGEDCLVVDRKHLPPVNVKLPTRIIILSNEVPRLADASGTIASRMIVLRMTKSWYGCEDTTLTNKLITELPGILLWAIGGWARLRRRGHFIQPHSAADVVGQMQDLASPVAAFAKERCLLGPELKVARSELYQAFVEWCQENGRVTPPDTAGFGRDLRAAFPTVGDSQPRIEGDKVRLYLGICLKTES